MESEKGPLIPGKLADCVVLSEDPTTCPPDRIKDIRVEATIVGGRVVFRNEPYTTVPNRERSAPNQPIKP